METVLMRGPTGEIVVEVSQVGIWAAKGYEIVQVDDPKDTGHEEETENGEDL